MKLLKKRRFSLIIPLFAAACLAYTVSRASEPHDIARAVQCFVDNHTLGGCVVLVASKGKVISLEAVGYSNIAAKKAMRTDALFWIASQSKPMTATALMMLVDEGKVNLDDPVEKYLPEFKGQMVATEQEQDHVLLKKPVHPITVREILSHTSGLPFVSRVESKIDMHPLREAVLSYALTSLRSQPGTRFEYSNAGINTAGRIIEVISGVHYEQFMEQRLFRPLGMKDTTFWPTKSQLRRSAHSYKPNATKTDLVETDINQLTYPLDDPKRSPSPAGGYFSTAQDLARFCQMVLNDGVLDGKRYVSEAAIRQMTSKQTPKGVNQSYGLGWFVDGSSFGHSGAYSTRMDIDPPHQLVLVFMVQQVGYAGSDGEKVFPAFKKAAEAIAK
jgi:CubicO group peptidase (beta-lactamase class C family)